MSYTLDIFNPDRETAEKIAGKHGVGILAALALLRIGIKDAREIENYIYPDPELRISPFAFKQMPLAVGLIKKCIDEKLPVFVFGDKDVDGVTSLATVVNFLNKLGLNVKYSMPVNGEPYGISGRAIKDIIDSKARLLITVDVGIKENENVEILKQKGIHVIITDHHESGETLPEADCIINVKCEKNFPVQIKNLSGCATAFKLCEGVLLSYWDEIDKTFACITKQGDVITSTEIKAMHVEKHVSGNASDYDFNKLDYIICHQAQKEYFTGVHNNVSTLKEYFLLKNDSANGKLEQILNKAEALSLDGHEYLVNGLIKIQRNLLPSIERFFNDFVDLTGMSTICDVMPLIGENRLFVKQMEKKLLSNGNSPIKALNLGLNFYRYNEPVTSKRVANYIGPCINSAGRMGKADISLNLLLDSMKTGIQENVKSLININNERKKIGKQAFAVGVEEIGDNPEGSVIIHRSEHIVPGITGVFAQKLAYHYERPVFVFTTDTATGLLSGSGRAPDGTNILSIIEQSEEYILNYGGHLSACGLSTNEEKYSALVERIGELSQTDEFKKLPETVIHVIAEVSPEEITVDNVQKLHKTGPFGEGTIEPYFIIKNAVLGPIKRFGSPDINARFKIHNNPLAECLGWGMAEQAEELFNAGAEVNIVFEPEINYFNGKQTVQMNVVKLIKAGI